VRMPLEQCKSAAEVRQHFEVVGEDGRVLRCTVHGCSAVLRLKDATATTNLRRHLGQTHGLHAYLSSGDMALARRNLAESEEAKRRRDELWQSRGVSISQSSTRAFFKLDKCQQKLISALLASFDIVQHMRPFTSLRDQGRRAMARLTGCHSSSAGSCRAIITEWLSDFIKHVSKELAEIDYISMTADGWTNFRTEHFAMMTLHFIDKAFTKVSAHCVSCVHQRDCIISAEVLARDVDRVLSMLGWPRDKPLAALTTDEGSNFRALVLRALTSETQRVISDTKVICVDHLLKTQFGHALARSPAVNAVFKRCESLSSICRSTRAVKMLLQDAQNELHRQDQRRPRRCTHILPVITRWGTHYDCILRLMAVRDGLNSVYATLVQLHGMHGVTTHANGKYKPFVEAMLTENEWTLVGKLIVLLAPFRSIVTLSQGEYYCTLATTWATLISYMETLEPDANDDRSIAEFKFAFLDQCQTAFTQRDTIPPSVLIALAIDPRYKCVNIFHRYPDIARYQTECLLAAVGEGMRHQVHDPPAQENPPPPQWPQAPPENPLAFDPSRMSMIAIQRVAINASQHLVGRMPPIPVVRVAPTPELLIQQYRSCEGLPLDATQKEVLRWFNAKHTANQFSVMLAIARCCVFIPATSAPAERVASTAGQVYNKRRLSLHEALAEAIVVLHESRRWIAHRIIDASPLVIQEHLKEALRYAQAITGDESGEEQNDDVETGSEGSLGSSDNDP
jgi:hypothetical protein